jgi:hypothetical protein
MPYTDAEVSGFGLNRILNGQERVLASFAVTNPARLSRIL